ncbi:MAG TPA: T9SS type A sorting domain-containing protein [Lutibacter sp.]|nr:T9SS type A sorting domain-containing protein [Lutibacter sp.]
MKKQLVLITLILQSVFTFAQVPTQEREALMALYNATNGPNWTFPGQWGSTTTPVADWFGIDVENIAGQDYVTDIVLDYNGLSGYIPSDIGNFPHLKTLILSANILSGNIPSEIGLLTNLETLYLEGCQLSGPIPNEIGNLTSLLDISLAGNQLTGSIPAEIGNLTNLWALNLAYNQLSGSIPVEIENLINIEGIALSNNEFSGELDLSNLSNLHGLLLENNNFSSINVRNENNTNFDFFNITNNPNLICVFVDDASWSETNWLDKDETAQYFETQTECDNYLTVDDFTNNVNFSIYPNPTNAIVTIESLNGNLIREIKIFTILGEQIKKWSKINSIDISNFSQGIYYIQILDDKSNQYRYKIIKK